MQNSALAMLCGPSPGGVQSLHTCGMHAVLQPAACGSRALPDPVPAGVAVLTVDKGGRRPLLLVGVGGMVLSALAIGIAVLASYSSMAVTYISIVGLFVFVGSYQARPLAGGLPLACQSA